MSRHSLFAGSWKGCLLAIAAWSVVMPDPAPVLAQGDPLNLDQLLSRLDEVPRDREVVALCASGYRSTIAASLIRREGAGEPTDLIGGVGGWEKAGGPMVGSGSACSAS